jgi:hypothetical protein
MISRTISLWDDQTLLPGLKFSNSWKAGPDSQPIRITVKPTPAPSLTTELLCSPSAASYICHPCSPRPQPPPLLVLLPTGARCQPASWCRRLLVLSPRSTSSPRRPALLSSPSKWAARLVVCSALVALKNAVVLCLELLIQWCICPALHSVCSSAFFIQYAVLNSYSALGLLQISI